MEYLNESALLYAGTFKVKINDQLQMLESQARYFSDIDMDDYNLLKKTIMATKGMGEFKRISVANSSGMTINYDGKSSGNIRKRGYFQKAMQGVPQVSSSFNIDEDGEKVLALAVPIFQNEKVVGVIEGTFVYSVLDNIFSVDTFRGNGYSFLSDKEGFILVGGENPFRICFDENWLNFLSLHNAIDNEKVYEIKEELQRNGTSYLTYTVDGKSRVMVYTPVFLNDWYVLSVVPSEYIGKLQSGIIRISFLMFLVMGGAILGFILIIINLIYHAKKIEKDNVRYAVATEKTRIFIFDYDVEHHIIEFTGNTSFFLGKKIEKLPLSRFGEIENRLHESERGLRERIRAFIESGDSSFSTEIRVLNKSGEYEWFRLTGSVIYNNDKKPAKFIGNAVNVNEQVEHELELKEMAENDLLSGLLNKTFIEKHVTEKIASGEINGVFYMIDLDNFKQVNDRIGHSAGDKAICDAATKLKLIFSENDYIGRLGGDEFCVFMCLDKNLSEDKVHEIIVEKARVLGSFLLDYYNSGDIQVKVSASIGIALFPKDGQTYKKLFETADSALYYIKKHGKNGYALFDGTKMDNTGESIYGV